MTQKVGDIDGPGPKTKGFRFGWLIETVVGIVIYFMYDTLAREGGWDRVGRAAPRQAGRRHRTVLRHLPGAPHPAGVPRLAPVHLVLEHLLRDDPLRDAGDRARRDVPQDAGALRAVAQHAAVHARVRAHRVLALPAHPAAPHARALRLRRHRIASSSTSDRSSRITLNADRGADGRGPRRVREPLRGDAEPARRLVHLVRARAASRCAGARGSRCSSASTRSRRSSRSSSPATTGSSTRSAAGWSSPWATARQRLVEKLLPADAPVATGSPA